MADFCTVQDVADFLQIDINTVAQIAAAQQAVSKATEAIRTYCHQYLELVTDDTITLDGRGGRRLHLPELPVVEVLSVTEDGELLTEGDDYKLGQHGILHRIGRDWSVGIQNIEIGYSHGYDIDAGLLPAIITDIAIQAASRTYQAGLKSAEMDGVPGVASYGLGDYNISFSSEHGGGVGEGVMGASASRLLLLSEKDFLYPYRIKQ